MAIETVRNVLVAAGAVTALVPASRITPLIRPQSITIPAITLQRLSLIPSNHLRGSGAADANLVELNVWADSYASARSIAAACRTALQAATFAMTLETDSYEEGVYPELYQITQTWQVWTT